MNHLISKILPLLLLFAIPTTATAQNFKFKKKIKKYVFKPKNGKLNYALQFDEVEFYPYGVWMVRNGNLWGAVDYDGIFIEPKYEEVRFVRNEKALVKLNEKFALINFDGTVEIDFIIDQVDAWYKEKNLVKVGEDWGSFIKGKFTKKINPVFQNPSQPAILKRCEKKDKKCIDRIIIDGFSQELNYPEEARKKGIEGIGALALNINTEGKLEEIEVLKKIGGGCDEEAIRVSKLLLSEWIPAYHDGEPVKSQFIIPVRFVLGRK